ncbi:hypothetical protein V8E55_001522 [Tylopilus felleus]
MHLTDCASSDDRSTWFWAVLRNDNVWEAHGQAVAKCRPYLPGSFDVAPRDPSLHANSWYKCTEYITWLYGLCPALLYSILPDNVWRNFCKFVAGLRIMKLQRAQEFFIQWERKFELLFYQRRVDRIHFVRPCIHLTCHLASEAARMGNLTREIQQPSDPFSNLAQQGIRRCQVNALKAMIPSLHGSDSPESLPCSSTDIGNGYVLLPKRDTYAIHVAEEEMQVVARSLVVAGYLCQQKVRRWGRLRLPNGQVARSAYVESQRVQEEVQMAQNIKVRQKNLCYILC